MRTSPVKRFFWVSTILLLFFMGCSGTKTPSKRSVVPLTPDMIELGKYIFRYDTLGDEAFWGGGLRLHEAIAGARLGGFGPGLSPQGALALGLKIDVEALPPAILEQITKRKLNLDDPVNTLRLMEIDAVVGVKGFFDQEKRIQTVGITCALCHSTVDDSLAPGIGRRIDGHPNRDLDVGALIGLSPNLQFLADRLGSDVNSLKAVLMSWGQGRYDAHFNMDGKPFREDGKTGATLIPAVFGLAGVTLNSYNGWGSVPNWNAYVAVTQMRARGSFFDPRLNDPIKYPLAVRSGEWNMALESDLVRNKLPALHVYQLSIAAPVPPPGSYDETAARRGRVLFHTKAGCSRCHVPPAFTEPVWPLHKGAEIGIDDFQSNRSPFEMYRTTPLQGLFTRKKGGFYHDGRFESLQHVVSHYDRHFRLKLSEVERQDLVEYLKSL